MNNPFTEEEGVIFDLIREVHHKYIELPVTHPSDRQDWIGAIHVLQRLMGQRILRREHPEFFVSHIKPEEEFPVPPFSPLVPIEPDRPFEPKKGLLERHGFKRIEGNLGLT